MDGEELGTSAFQRIIDVIRVVSERPGITLTELAESLGVHKSTAHRICAPLVRAGFLEPLSQEGAGTGRLRYRLGIWLFVLGSRAVAALELKRQAPPILRRLARAVQLPVYLTVVWKGLTICIDEEPGPTGSVWLGSAVGVPHPNHATATGKLYLASLPDEELPAPQATQAGVAEAYGDARAALLAKVAQVREHGYAFNDEETEYGVRYLGVPVRDGSGRFLAALTVGATVEQHTPDELIALVPQLRTAADALEARVAPGALGTTGVMVDRPMAPRRRAPERQTRRRAVTRKAAVPTLRR